MTTKSSHKHCFSGQASMKRRLGRGPGDCLKISRTARPVSRSASWSRCVDGCGSCVLPESPIRQSGSALVIQALVASWALTAD